MFNILNCDLIKTKKGYLSKRVRKKGMFSYTEHYCSKVYLIRQVNSIKFIYNYKNLLQSVRNQNEQNQKGKQNDAKMV